ncbi:hypothetical protein LCGC14_1174500 [marine sediment metagenome]|uniref:Uncharacterized protein n=1 Tax=marine sediment metagenome TaxID=412755 RepID=A0A0F9P716_9ZZZZ
MVRIKCPKCPEEEMFNLKWTKNGWIKKCSHCGFEMLGEGNTKINEEPKEENEDEIQSDLF